VDYEALSDFYDWDGLWYVLLKPPPRKKRHRPRVVASKHHGDADHKKWDQVSSAGGKMCKQGDLPVTLVS